LADDRGEAPWLVSCNATMVVVCTDLGAGYTLVTVLDTFNSHAATSCAAAPATGCSTRASKGTIPMMWLVCAGSSPRRIRPPMRSCFGSCARMATKPTGVDGASRVKRCHLSVELACLHFIRSSGMSLVRKFRISPASSQGLHQPPMIVCFGERMVGLTAATAAPDQIAYMDAAASTVVGLDYKQRFVACLDVRSGQTVTDIGCGPGTDLGRLADAVGEDGSVIGVDQQPRMLEEARRRLADRPNVKLLPGDVHDLPISDGGVDRARVDRVLQHVADPAKAVREVRRALRPGGLFGMAEPDWDTLAVADEDLATSRQFTRFVASRVRNPTIGRELVRLCLHAGLGIRSVEPVAVLFRDFTVADQILGLRRNAARAVLAGGMRASDTEPWLQRLVRGPVVASFTFYLVVAEA
jgi:ubiquinone/menaquinone biosynthesis C-methylase UbiE